MTDMTRLRVCLLLVALAVTSVLAAGDVEINYDLNGPALNDVCGLTVGNDAVFWAVGDQGKVFKIVNGSISTEYTLGDYDLHGVSFADGDHGWIVGYRRYDPNDPDSWRQGVVFRTTTGGGGSGAWTPSYPSVQTGINVPFLKVQVVDNSYVWVTCGDGNVLWSWSGGSAWFVRPKPAGAGDYSYLWGLWAFDANHAWVASDESMMIAKTTDAGETWTAYRPFPDDSLSYRGIGPYDLGHGPDFDYMSVAATRGEIVHTTDGGSTWSKESYNPCQWWRGTSQSYTECGGRLCVGTSGIPGSTTRYDLNDAEQIEVGYDHWNVSVGTNTAIEVDSFNFSPGILEECKLDELDAVGGNGGSVFLNFHFTNTTGTVQTVTIYVWRGICEEDQGGTQSGYSYRFAYTIPNVSVPEGSNWLPTWTTPALPYRVTYWFAATTSLAANYSASPNVDSAHAANAPYHSPVPAPSWFTAADVPGDHGSSLQYQWEAVPGMDFVVIRPRTETHPFYYGHQGGLVQVVLSGHSYSESELVTGVQYRRGVRSLSLDGTACSLTFAENNGTPVDNVKPPMVTGLTVSYVTQLDALEVWWNPIPESGLPGQPETYEPNLGGYWVCPYIADAALDDPDPHDTHLNHQSPLFRSHYLQPVPEEAHGHQWCFSIAARDRSENRSDWCPDLGGTIPNLASTSALATAYNNSTHLARVPGTATEHVVYESNAEIHYANSTDGGDEWHDRTVLDTGASPAVATDETGDAWVVYLKDNVVRYKVSNSTAPSPSRWSGGVLFDPNDANVILGPPAIAAAATMTTQYAFAAFPVYDLDAGASSIMVVKFDGTTSASVTVDAEPNLALSDSFVSLSLTPGDIIHCCWQRDSAIVHSEADVTPGQWDNISWSETCVLSEPGTLAKHPFCEVYGDEVFAVWSDQDEGEIMRVEQLARTPEAWSTPENVSSTEEFSDYPQMSTPCVVSWQDLKGNGNWEFMARAGDDLVTLSPTVTGNSRFGDISAQLADSTDVVPSVVYAIWTEGTTQDDYYEVKSATYEPGDSKGQMTARSIRLTTTELSSVVPNPFSHATGIRYQLARPGRTRLSIFDATGREVRTLVNSQQSPGAYSVTWNGTDSRERSLPKGVYFVRFTAPECTGQRKLTLTR